MTLEEKQAAMREKRLAKMAKTREIQERLRAERKVANKESTEIDPEIARKLSNGDLKCPYCLRNKTTIHLHTKALNPCKSCLKVARRIKAVGYRTTLHDYRRMLGEQNSRCAICGKEFTFEDKSTTPVIDHCHDLEHVRGLLCNSCNSALGMFKESDDILEMAIKYLKFNKLSRRWWFSKEKWSELES